MSIYPRSLASKVVIGGAFFCFGAPTSFSAVVDLLPRAFRTVALNNTPLPGLPSEARAEQFGSPQIDRRGIVSFSAQLRPFIGGVTFENDGAIWKESQPGQANLVAREGALIADSDYRHEGAFTISTSAAGDLFFATGMLHESFYSGGQVPAGQSAATSGLFRFEQETGARLLATSGPTNTLVPAAGGTNDSFAFPLDVNEQQQIVVRTGSGSGSIYVFDDQAGLSLIGNGATPVINEQGDVLYRRRFGVVDSLVVGNRNRRRSTTLVTMGESANGAEGAIFDRFLNLSNSAGSAIFTAQLTGSGVDANNDFGIWSETNGLGSPLQKVLREGDPAPGVDDGSVFAGFNLWTYPETFGNTVGLAVTLGLAGPNVTNENNSGFWVGVNPFELRLVMRKGDPAPGVPGERFRSLLQNGGVTADGRGVFAARLVGTDDTGIWGEHVDGSLKLIAKTGDGVRLPSGEVTQLRSPRLDQNYGIGPLGHVVFFSSLTNGHFGLFVSDAIAIPEPNSTAWITVLTAMAWRFHRRTRA
ncbi:DUF7453 family protein [Botrimarina hoheduenensis]|uniref:Uncharacterized protein n=1 Tax=Botrimarina hoheduenensis TaxID=2528000 RepID=A0A5C5W9Q1_9BACT|nr:choice-of-anchor tandem repeat NxxGxxAF-containing protein [Botrimarina hoheduenensis]TWT46925.1 hypothetical protein Pla111_20270 [Botrimarina hoheduenensis]